MTSNIALVLRATGTQGKSVVKYLLDSNWTVHALVTDPGSPRAQELQSLGAVLFQGTLSDPKSIETAIQGSSALFLAQMPSFTDDSEVQDASAILQLAKKAGVKHVVHTTTLPLKESDVRVKYSSPPLSALAPAILPKGDVENLVQSSGLPWTIIRPGYFMSNFILPTGYFSELAEGRLVTQFLEDTILPLVDPDDIGSFAAAAFNEPTKFQGRFVTLASEKLKVEQIAAEIGRVSGKTIETSYATEDELKAGLDNPYFIGQIVSRDLDRLVDMEEVRSWGVPLTTFRAFLERNKDHVLPAPTAK